VRRESNWIRAEGGVRYACVGVAIGRRGVDGPATGEADAPEADADADEATRRRLGLDGVKMVASAISTSSPSPSDEDEVAEAEANCALLTGMTRVAAAAVEAEAEEEEEARRGRFFDGVSGAKMPSSSSEADTMSESEKATLRFALLFMREGVQFALESRIADLVGEADRECDGVLVGVFFDVDADAAANAAPEGSALAFFLRISLTVARMDSLNSMHSSSIIFTRRLKSLSETPCLSTNGIYCTLESWAGRKVRKKNVVERCFLAA
jgi:hypothetical protein